MRFARRMALVAMAVLVAACGDGVQEAIVGSGADQRYEGTFTVLESGKHGPELCHLVAASLPPQCGGVPVRGWNWDAVEGEQAVSGTRWGSWRVTGTYEGAHFTLTQSPGPAQLASSGEDAPDFSPACDEPDVVDPTQGGAEWEAMSQDYGPFEIPNLAAIWLSAAGEKGGRFVGNVVVLPGAGQAATERVRAHYGGYLCVVEREGPTAARLTAIQDELTDDDARRAIGEIVEASADLRRGAVVARVWATNQAALDYAYERWGNLVQLSGLLKPID